MQVFSTKKVKPHLYPFLGPHDDPTPYVDFEPIEFSISEDGKEWHSIYDQPDLKDVLCYLHSPAPVQQEDNLEKLGLQDGQKLNSTSYNTREITMSIHFYGMNEADAFLAFDALQKFMDSREAYWICWADFPQRMYKVRAKLAAPTFTSERGWTCQVTLTDLYGLSRSVGTTADFDNMVEGFGNNQPINRPQYVFTTNQFTVQNTSEVMIDPERRGKSLTITLEGSANGDMSIKNKTTGDEVTRKGGWSGTWSLVDVNPMLNGNHDGINTNHKIITLAKGPNEFVVSGFQGKITFDFPLWWQS